MGVAIAAERSVHGARVDGVGSDAATFEEPAQLPHEHDDGELWDGENPNSIVSEVFQILKLI